MAPVHAPGNDLISYNFFVLIQIQVISFWVFHRFLNITEHCDFDFVLLYCVGSLPLSTAVCVETPMV
uniref:Uncharacterized protein n=1 Tax=Cannabis sativa TaxID=3483 RepID=A0A803R1G8_CANSA